MSEILLIIPLMLYATMPAAWQSAIRLVGGVVVVIAAILVLRKYRRESRAFAASDRAAGYSWRDGASAAAFQVGLMGHCKGHGWRVFWSEVLDPQRVVFGIVKRKRQLVLLCLRPGEMVTERDVTRVDRWRAENKAERALIIAGLRFAALPQAFAAGCGVEVLAYDALLDRAVLS